MSLKFRFFSRNDGYPPNPMVLWEEQGFTYLMFSIKIPPRVPPPVLSSLEDRYKKISLLVEKNVARCMRSTSTGIIKV